MVVVVNYGIFTTTREAYSMKYTMKHKVAAVTVTAAMMFGSLTVLPAPAAYAAQSAEVTWGVNLRTGPSSSYDVIRMLKKGENVSIIAEKSGWYKVSDANGRVGYISSSSKYTDIISGSSVDSGTSGSGNTSAPSTTPQAPTSSSASVEKVIAAGMKYLGTPYEFGSNRSTTTTFDCSDFVRQAFKDALGITLPADSRKQGTYVKNKGNYTTNINNLKRGDLMFFMSYKGSSASSYSGINKSAQRITHVGIYLGDGKILHTYSKESGGVTTGTVTGKHWEYRFVYGGSAL
jgi:peptidoglycan DL-endopeptidase CwlO